MATVEWRFPFANRAILAKSVNAAQQNNIALQPEMVAGSASISGSRLR